MIEVILLEHTQIQKEVNLKLQGVQEKFKVKKFRIERSIKFIKIIGDRLKFKKT